MLSTGGGTTRGSEATSSVDSHGGSSDGSGEGKGGWVGDGVGHKADISLSDIMHELRALRRGQREIEPKDSVPVLFTPAYISVKHAKAPLMYLHLS